MGKARHFLIALIAVTPAIVCSQTVKPTNACSQGENVSSKMENDSEINRLTSESNSRKTRAERWDALNIGFVFLAAVAGVGLVITSVGVSRSNRAFNEVAEQLGHAKDLEAEAEIAAVNCVAGTANERSGKLEVEAARQRERAAKAEHDYLELKRQMAGRHLTPDQIQAIIAALKPFAGTHVNLFITSGDDEIRGIANDIGVALGDKGAQWKITVSAGQRPTAGPAITVEGPSDNNGAAFALAVALREKGQLTVYGPLEWKGITSILPAIGEIRLDPQAKIMLSIYKKP
jgi:hypothetical protein